MAVYGSAEPKTAKTRVPRTTQRAALPVELNPRNRPWYRSAMQSRSEYILFTEALPHASGQLMWRFLLLRAGCDQTVTASDLVDEDSTTRTELLAVVRGLEAIDGPANVRLFTTSDYIQRGFARGLAQWRRQDWHWERFGRRVPIRDSQLWQRVDHALAYHAVEARFWGDPSHSSEGLAWQAAPACELELETNKQDSVAAQEAAISIKSSRRRRTVRRPGRVAAATRSKLDNLRRGVESLLEPALMSAG